jgi:mercuric ion transport protein
MKTLTGYLLTATALIACPCHLPFTLPLALALLGGTASGAALGANIWLVVAGATVYFVAALAAGLYLLNRRADDEKANASRTSHLQELSKGAARSE